MVLPSEADFWAARLCVDFGVRGFTKLHVRLACTSRMLSRTTLRANAASRGTTRPTTGKGLNRVPGLAYWYALPPPHAFELLN